MEGNQHQLFTLWAEEQGVKINAVAPTSFPGRGLGIAAKRKIQAGEELVHVPVSALFTTDSIPQKFRSLHQDISVHGLLASYLGFGEPPCASPYASWRATWPSMQDFVDSMPIMWPDEVTEIFHHLSEESKQLLSPSSSTEKDGKILCTDPTGSRKCNGNDANSLSTHGFCPLPPGIGGQFGTVVLSDSIQNGNRSLLHKQKRKLKKDWDKVSTVLPNADLDTYTYYWLIVNTRSFYFEAPRATQKLSPEDCLVLCPFADYFNHAVEGCNVSFDDMGLTITSNRAFESEEEVFVTYGSHNNDFLLTEYGFILEENKWDTLLLDDLVLRPPMTRLQKERLDGVGYLGKYILDHEGVCWRTQVAIRTQTLDTRNWHKFVAGNDVDLEYNDQSKADSFINSLIQEYKAEADKALEGFQEGGKTFPAGARDVLIRRWTQIKVLLDLASKSLI